LAVLTHIDGLSPLLEWSPPYQWQTRTGAKEQSIREAVEYTGQLFGYWLSGAVPACTDVDRDRVYGVHEWVLPAMAALVDQARATALVRTLHKGLDSGQLLQVVAQLYNAGTRCHWAQTYSRPMAHRSCVHAGNKSRRCTHSPPPPGGRC
jgi:hypothetical protein